MSELVCREQIGVTRITALVETQRCSIGNR